MGTATFSETDHDLWGHTRVKYGTITLSSSYATGGDTFNFANVGTEKMIDVSNVYITPLSGDYILVPDVTNNKVKAFYGDYSNGSDGALVEVAAAVNLSPVTGVVMILSKK